MKYVAETTIGIIIENHPNGKNILEGFGLHCFSCPMAQMETIAEACQSHGIQIDLMLEKLNK